MEKKYKYTGYFMMLLVPLVSLAFYKTYFISFPEFPEKIQYYDHIHATLATSWVLMLIVQPLFILYNKHRIHRIIGKISYIIFPLLILSFIPRELIVWNSANRKDLFFPLADSLVLITLFVLAIYNKKNTPNHMRYFISSALVLLGPIIGRIGPIWLDLSGLLTQNIQYTTIQGILLSLIIYDRNLTKSKPYIHAIGLFVLHQLCFYLLFL